MADLPAYNFDTMKIMANKTLLAAALPPSA
jgi:hypothetical protein